MDLGLLSLLLSLWDCCCCCFDDDNDAFLRLLEEHQEVPDRQAWDLHDLVL